MFENLTLSTVSLSYLTFSQLEEKKLKASGQKKKLIAPLLHYITCKCNNISSVNILKAGFFLRNLHIKDLQSFPLDCWYGTIFGLHPHGIFLQAGNPLSILYFTHFGVRGDSVPTPRDVDSHQCSWTYSNTLPRCQGGGEEKQKRKREDYELNVDLSSAGCRSKEQHWQAEHRIHQSLLSMPSSSFSEVDEHRGPWL